MHHVQRGAPGVRPPAVDVHRGRMWYTFEAIDVPEGGAHVVDRRFLAQTGGLVFEAGFDFNPFWSVCAQYESAPCGGLVEQCYSNLTGWPRARTWRGWIWAV